MRASRSRLATLPLLLVLLGGASCTSDAAPEPAPLPSESPSESEPASESPTTAPTLPAEAEGTSAKAAKAFARHYVASINFAMASGDTQQLDTLSTAECATCDSLRDRIADVYGASGQFEGGEWTVLGASVSRLPKSEAFVLVGVQIAEQIVTERSGGTPKTNAATRGSLEFRMRPNGATWSIYRLDAR